MSIQCLQKPSLLTMGPDYQHKTIEIIIMTGAIQ